MTWWMWYAAGMATVVVALAIAALVSRWLSRQHPTHRAGIDEDEDDPEQAAGVSMPRLRPTSRRGHRRYVSTPACTRAVVHRRPWSVSLP
jgi:hypothetical protein